MTTIEEDASVVHVSARVESGLTVPAPYGSGEPMTVRSPWDLGSAADQRDSLRNVGSEQAKSEMVRGNGVYLCPEGVCGAQEAAAAGVSSWISGGSVSSNLARMARCAAVISLRWRKLPAAPRKLPSCSF